MTKIINAIKLNNSRQRRMTRKINFKKFKKRLDIKSMTSYNE
ncbi:hypothetical protein HMPREF3189_00691 [Clostridiales bacterium KA00134]|nr:hypothetical protein HMPREF3189_00691 [Clostridiales bacterium KA00134]